ncbi:hypothetical protein CLOM_g6589 [Closterium sp. NIES-68]|nr:hypothetical protein CLOM_g6589 [Closterium sp. NIES-68]GJP69585.1 hypothetical protein CLOP_g582 [Closterium sp. NIES-67]
MTNLDAEKGPHSLVRARSSNTSQDSQRRRTGGRAGGKGGEKGGARDSRDGSLIGDDVTQAESERVRVTIRVRPPTEEEAASNGEFAMDISPEDSTVVLHRSNGQLEQMEFEFDSVLPPTATQADVYQVAAKPVVADVLNGYNGTVMAYGQTGAGKTYTLSSTKPSQLGIIPRAAAEVFVMARADPSHTYRVSMSYIQIYMEMIQDLLRPSSSNMQIRESENGVYISGVEEVEVTCVEDCLKLLAVGERNRTVAFTKMNAHSSRSHAIAIITVEKKRRKEVESSDSEGNSGAVAAGGHGSEEHRKPEKKDKILVGKLFLVDLAGSERLKKSGSEGLRASEAKSVNLSLTVLGKCINARADPHAHHVPFRDSKLTRLLQESLGGNAKTSLVINVAPTIHHLNESLSSLLFGSRAMEVKTKAVVNEEEEYRILTRTLQETIDEHDDRVHSLEVVVYSQEEQLSQAKASLDEQKELVGALQAEREEMEQKLAEGVAAVEEEWTAKLEKAEAEASQRMDEAQQTFSEGKEGCLEADCPERHELASPDQEQREGVERDLFLRRLKERHDEEWEDGSGVRELLGAFTSAALSHVQNLSKATEQLSCERDEMAKELTSAQEMVQRLEQQLREALEAKGHLEDALLVASESGEAGDGSGLQLLVVEKAARQQAEKEAEALRAEKSQGQLMLEETERKLAKQTEETAQRTQEVRSLKAENKRLNELVVATSRALVAGAADAAGRALSSLDHHFCAPKIKA